MYETRGEPALSRAKFAWRLFWHVLAAAAFIVISILIGAAGHIMLDEQVQWHDAVLNAAMIAGGLGPLMVPESFGGKAFFAVYGAYVSLVFIATLGVVLAPVAHRVLHVFHLDES